MSNDNNGVLEKFINTITEQYEKGEIRIRYIQSHDSTDGKETTWQLSTVKVEVE